MEHHTPTSLLERRGQREEIGSKETEVSVLHVVPYDWDQPAARELQVIPEKKKKENNMKSNHQ